MNAAVSVIIPTYNNRELLRDSVGSVLNQSFADFELLIIDDGSKDNTAELVKTFTDKRIKYHYKTNGGTASARNMGIAKAAGKYITFLDSDDFWPRDYLKTMVNALDLHQDYGMAYCTITQEWPDKKQKKSFRIEYCVSGNIVKELFNKNFVMAQTAVCRSEMIKDFRFDESLRWANDYDGFLRMSAKCKFLFISDVEVILRIRPDSDSGGQTLSGDMSTNKAGALERFFFRLEGSKYVSRTKAMRRLANCYKEAAKCYLREGCRKAALASIKKAISYQPKNLKLYLFLTKAALTISKDKMPNWISPQPLAAVESSS